jgi:hypothetical protein
VDLGRRAAGRATHTTDPSGFWGIRAVLVDADA